MGERADVWVKVIRPHLLVAPATTLDFGGGSGEVAKRLSLAFDYETAISDVLHWSRYAEIPFYLSKDNRVAAADRSFKQVVALTVFHHADNVSALVSEAFRLADKRVLFIESVTNSILEFKYGSWIDWFYNRVIHYMGEESKKINVPCNFLPASGWEQRVWELTGLQPTVSKALGIFQNLNPEFHHLFVYDKAPES